MHKQLEKYLLQIEKQLAALPAEQREEELREIRSHLEMMIEDNFARGCDADDAVTKALEQFGAAGKVGCELMETKPLSWFQRFHSIAAMFVAFIAAVFLMVALSTLLSKFLIALQYPFGYSWQEQLIQGMVPAVIAGWIAEVIAPRKAMWALAVIFLGILGVLIFSSGSFTLFGYALFTFVGISFFIGSWLRRWQVERRNNQHMTTAE